MIDERAYAKAVGENVGNTYGTVSSSTVKSGTVPKYGEKEYPADSYGVSPWSGKELGNTLEGEVERRRCRRDYGEYVRVSNDGFYMTHMHRYVCDVAQAFLEANTGKAMDVLLISVPPRHGKEVADSQLVLTSEGWKRHGDLQVGDRVYAPDGRQVEVRALIPQEQPCTLLVTLTNGEQIKVHPNHEWVVKDRRSHTMRTVETRWMMEQGLTVEGEIGHRGCRYRFNLPLVDPLQNPERELGVSPYFLGAWLGDGTYNKTCITEGAQDICVLEECAKYYPATAKWVHNQTGVPTWYYSDVRWRLREIGVLGDKHIPDEYLVASYEQRLELLAGLMDTDGHLDKTGRYRYSTVNEKLRDGVCALIGTFGCRYSVSVADPFLSSSGVLGKQKIYSIAFTPTFYVPCRVPRKQNHLYTQPMKRMISICKIETCEPEHGQCITVDGGVYLVGKTMQPTHNSFMLTETLPSWFLGKNPTGNVIICGYEGTFAEGFSRRNRDKFNRYAKDVFRVEENPNIQGVAQWETAAGGRCRAAGLKGGITGFGAELFIIDDPIKNQEMAESETVLSKIHDEMGPSVQSRIHPGGKLIVIQTRWVENDVIGYIQSNWSDYVWADINLPCECEDEATDPLGRKLGDSLMGAHMGDFDLPQRIRNDNIWLKSKKMLVCAGEGERVWNALYQGHPSAQNGNLFRDSWWKRYCRKIGGETEDGSSAGSRIDIADMEYTCLSVDATFKKTETSDRVAITLWGLSQKNAYLYKLINKRMGFTETVERIKRLCEEYPGIDQLIIEDKANGSAIIDTLKYTDGIPPIVAVNPLGGKYSRAQAVSPFIAGGSVYIPVDFTESERREIEDDNHIETGYGRFLYQMSHFPFAKNDDMVDSMSQALSRLIKIVTGEDPAPEKRWTRFTKWYPDMWEDFEQMNSMEQEEFIRTYGAPLEWEDD